MGIFYSGIFFKEIGIAIEESLQAVLKEKCDQLEANRIRATLGSTKLKKSEKLQNNIIEQLRHDRNTIAEGGGACSSSSVVEYKSAKSIVLASLQDNRENNKNDDKGQKTCKYYFLCAIR